MTAAHPNTTLHERSSKSFSRTPTGLIFTDNIKTVYSILLICLDLKEKPTGTKSLIGVFNKSYPYSFTLQEAITKMQDLELQVDMNNTSISISYSIKPELAHFLLKTFMTAKLLHTPADRTRDAPKDGVVFQPTPKGVAVLQKYVRDAGIKKIPKILLSNLNSMELFNFERNSATDSIIYSNYLIFLLFVKAMGPAPNIWAPTNPHDKIPVLSKLLEYSNESFSFENLDYNGVSGFQGGGDTDSAELSWTEQLNGIDLDDTTRVSPFGHKFFTNPDSDSHVQYYVSDKGLRLFGSKDFGLDETTINFCFTSKALWQYFMDCTDIIYPKEAVSLTALFLKKNLIAPILLPPSKSSTRKFHISRSCFYTVNKLGYEVMNWDYETGKPKSTSSKNNLQISTPNSQTINVERGKKTVLDDSLSLKSSIETANDADLAAYKQKAYFNYLDDVLKDPGMRYLFRRCLEKELCVENFDAYIEIKKFLKKMTVLKTLIDNRDTTLNNSQIRTYNKSNKIVNSTIEEALIKQANECLEMTYHIYSSYIMVGAPSQLNIDHGLRESISGIMLHPQSPIAKTFDTYHSKNDEAFATSSNEFMKDIRAIQPVELAKIDSVCQKETVPASVIKSVNREGRPKSLIFDETTDPFFSTVKENSIILPDDEISITLSLLKKLYPLFEKVSTAMYKLMESDSLPKFMNSGTYKEAIAIVRVQSD